MLNTMSPMEPFLLISTIFKLLSYISGTYGSTVVVYRVPKGQSKDLFHEKLLDTSKAMSVLDCARQCSRRVECGGYDFYDTNGTCHIKLCVAGPAEPYVSTYRKVNDCPASLGYHLAYIINTCFKVYLVNKTWDKAEKQCIADGGHLLKLDSKVELDEMITFAKNIDYLIVGAKDENRNGQWKWIDGTAVNGDLWGLKEPSRDGYCTDLYKGGLNDYNCFLPLSFACEIVMQ